MPVKLKERINKDTVIGLWEIEEDASMMLSKLNLSEEERFRLDAFVNEERKKHWLSYRLLLNELLKGKDVSIKYDDNGKPYVENSTCHISVAHAGKYSAAIVSQTSAVGIDIEKNTPRIEKIVSKFLSQDEIDQLDPDNRLENLYVYWGAKESLYKLFGRKRLDFRKHMSLEKTSIEMSGSFSGRIHKEDWIRDYTLNYRIIENYILVYVKE